MSTLYTRLRALATSLVLEHKDTPQNRSKPATSPKRLEEYTRLVGRPHRHPQSEGFFHTPPNAKAPIFPSKKQLEEQKKKRLLLQLMQKKSRRVK